MNGIRDDLSQAPAQGLTAADGVSIVTRTRDRPLMIRRSIESVLNQNYENWEHIIVNDAGNEKDLQGILGEYATRYGTRLKVINNPMSRGAVVALNVGLAAARLDYVVSHDDDDSWEPKFLGEMIESLKIRKKLIPNTRGIISHATAVVEHIYKDSIIEDYRYSMNGWVKAVSLSRFAATNFIPPISFLFERAVLSEIGLFNDLKFADDWEFYLRFLCRFEIAVLPNHLAKYHIRPKSRDAYGNTVAINAHDHLAVIAALRNDILRKDLESGKLGLGYLVALSTRGPVTGNLKHQLWLIRQQAFARWKTAILRILSFRRLKRGAPKAAS